jgi:hypothetical protein
MKYTTSPFIWGDLGKALCATQVHGMRYESALSLIITFLLKYAKLLGFPPCPSPQFFGKVLCTAWTYPSLRYWSTDFFEVVTLFFVYFLPCLLLTSLPHSTRQ